MHQNSYINWSPPQGNMWDVVQASAHCIWLKASNPIFHFDYSASCSIVDHQQKLDDSEHSVGKVERYAYTIEVELFFSCLAENDMLNRSTLMRSGFMHVTATHRGQQKPTFLYKLASPPSRSYHFISTKWETGNTNDSSSHTFQPWSTVAAVMNFIAGLLHMMKSLPNHNLVLLLLLYASAAIYDDWDEKKLDTAMLWACVKCMACRVQERTLIETLDRVPSSP